MNKKIDLNDLGFISSVAKDLDEHLDDLIGVNKIIAGVGEFLDDYGLRHELGFSYSNQKNNLNKLSDDIKVFSDAATTGSGYNGYANVNSVEDILYSCLEHPFYLSLNDTIESLAEVEIERYKVDNPNGKSIVTMEEKWIESVYKNNTRVLKANTHSKLGINDLLKTQYSRKLMKRNYERYLQTLYPDIKDFDGIDTDIFYDAYLTSILTQADFEHTTFLENSMNMLRTTGGILGAGVLFFSVVPGAATFFGINMGGLTMASGVVNGSISVIDAVCLFSGKDINGNPLSQEEREALIASVAIDATFLSVSVAGKIRYNSSKGSANIKLDYETTSGLKLEAIPSKTTTIIGNFNDDMKYIIDELGDIKSTNFEAKPGGFNVLNVPDDEWIRLGPDGFWDTHNAPWLQQAINRQDIIKVATPITDKYIYRLDDFGNRVLTGFGREVQMLDNAGYIYDITTSSFYKP